jgi:Dyp-type peroxidase family
MSGSVQIKPGTSYTVQSGDTLSGIAQNAYGNGADWPIIYDANKEVIGPNPDLIRVGEVLVIPTLTPTPGAVYVVQQDDTLTLIAQRAYGNGNLWPLIYKANEQVIGSDPNLIQPGQVLHIPLASSDDLPLRKSQLIQGDILAGFNKDHRVYLFYSFHDQASGRAWLKELIPLVAKTKDVADFNASFSAARAANRGNDPSHLKATWFNVSLTFSGLTTLLNAHSNVASDITQTFRHFALGPAADEVTFTNGDKDRSNPNNPSDPKHWKFGSNNQIHALLNIQADDPKDLQAKVQALQALASKHSLHQVFEQDGTTLPDPLVGHEHFGFKDGISQPGVAGFDLQDGTSDPNAPLGHVSGHPGTEIIQPGEFILGEAVENDTDPSGQTFPPASISDLGWMKDGSFQVVRRLKQNVFQFREEIKSALPADGSMNADALGAKLVGRWKSGIPVDLSPDQDHQITADINDFAFADDKDGLRCPRFAHIRKVYPRDNDAFGNRARRIIRRGVPFGPPFNPANEHNDNVDRGLFFVAYMASIENQFEFLMSAWVNNASFPFDVPQGPDAVIGQPFPPSACTIQRTGKPPLQHTFQQVVDTTGTLYAFVPSLAALNQLANGQI